MNRFKTCILGLVSPLAFVSLALSAHAQAPGQSFSDIKANDPLFAASEYVRAEGMMKGYEDGTFRAGTKLNRAETIKIILSTLVEDADLKKVTKSVYTDVADDAWYLPYVELARQKFGIIDGPPKTTTFNPGKIIKKAEFYKMFLLANGIDAKAMYSELKMPLSSDVKDASQWYYPLVRYALASSMTMVTADGKLGPDRELTRGDIALFLYRHAMYKDGRRTQALLSEAESEIVNVLQLMESDDIENAEYASARSLLAARGALTSKPEDIVKGAVKTAEGFQVLTQAYRAGKEKRFDDVIQLSSDAWHLAEKARVFTPTLKTVADQMQTIAKNMADQARAMKAQ